MKAVIKWFDKLSKVVKIIFAIPFLDILWTVYRILRSANKKNTLGIVLGVVLIVLGLPWLWLVDIITIALKNKVLWID